MYIVVGMYIADLLFFGAESSVQEDMSVLSKM